MINMADMYEGDPRIMFLVLRGALTLMESAMTDIEPLLREQHNDYLLIPLRLARTAFRWALRQIRPQAEKESA